MSRRKGRVRVHPRGFGFVEYEDPEPRSAFIAPPDLADFLHGDRVSFLLQRSGRSRFAAKDLTLVERQRNRLFGLVGVEKSQLVLRPDPQIAPRAWALKVEGTPDPEDGVHAIAELKGDELWFLRSVSESEAALERVRARYGIRTEFPAEVVQLASEAPALETAGRRDLREVVTLTIDAPTTRDLDDAISVLPADAEGGIRVLVSIADVDAQVSAQSPLDVEAKRRGTSVYLAGGTTPMLPPELSELRCSLLPGEDRAALTVEMRIDTEGDVTSVDLYESLIRSDQRLSYEEAAALLLERQVPGVPDGVAEAMRWLRTASARLAAMRMARGGVNILRREAYIRLDHHLEVDAIEEREDLSSHDLVERMMVAANEAVARWLIARGLPGLFRVHDAPSGGQVKNLVRSAHRLGLKPGFGDTITPRALAAFAAQYAGTGWARAADSIVGKALGPARYQSQVDMHFGLGSPGYLHFTSPIRRYADLVVHRIVKAYLRGDRDLETVGQTLPELAMELNELARRASKAEAERERMLAARHFRSRVAETFDGRVVAVKSFGLVVHIFGTGITGVIPVEGLPEGAEYRGDRFAWDGGRLASGSRVRVKVLGTDEALGRIELRFLEGETRSSSS